MYCTLNKISHKTTWRLLLRLGLLSAVLTGCATKTSTPVEVGDAAPGSFITSWSTPIDLKSGTRFYLEGTQLFLYDPLNVVADYDLKGGLKFRTQIASTGDVVGQPMVQADRYIFPTSSTLELITPSGVHVKTIPLAQPLRSPGVAIEQTVYIGTDSANGGVLAAVALDRTFNYYRWTAYTGLVHTRPVVHDNVVYCATEDGRVIALNADRSPLWAIGPEMPDGIFHTAGKIVTPIKADEAGVYVASTDTKLYCLDPNTGHVRWEFYAGIPVDQSPVPTADTVYLYQPGSGIVAIDKKTSGRARTARWTYSDGTQLLSDDTKYAYLLTKAGSVAAVDKATGKLQFETKNTKIAKAVTHVDPKDATIFAITTDNKLVAITPVLKTGVVGMIAMAD